MKLYSYWRSTAAYRVRIALNLKDVNYEYVPINLVKDGGVQHQEEYKSKNPQSLVPLLDTGEGLINQSLAIINYLDNKYPDPPLYGDSNYLRARLEGIAQSICCDIHPLNNLRVMQYLKSELDHTQEDVLSWYHHWLEVGFDALEVELGKCPTNYCLTNSPSVADICLVAQLYNARRFNFSLVHYPNIVAVEQRCLDLTAFAKAIPENQIDAE